MNKKYYEAPLMELLSVEVTSSFATSECVSTPKGLDRLESVETNWD